MNPFADMLVCLVDEDWNQLTTWREIGTEVLATGHVLVEWDRARNHGSAVGYLIRHRATGMIGHSEITVPINIGEFDSVALYIEVES